MGLKMDEQRIFDLKNLCVRKWRVENPKGYFGQMQHTSTRGVSEWICRLAGFKTLEEADVYFRHQTAQEQKAMIEKAIVIQKAQPATTPKEQEYIRSQLQSGLEGTEIKRTRVESMAFAPVMLVALFIGLLGYLLLGRK